jgi:hypothetical protein
MPLEDEINARLRHLSEEIRAFRQNIDQLRRSDQPALPARADEKARPPGPALPNKPEVE